MTPSQVSIETQGGLVCGVTPKQQTDGRVSRSSSIVSVSSTGTLSSQMFPLDELPDRALEIIFEHLGPIDKIRLERTNKSWLGWLRLVQTVD